MNEEEARVEHARLRAAAVDWSRRLQAEPDNKFLQAQRDRAVARAETFGVEVLRAVMRG